jgi:hypothetical protein
MPPVDRPIVSAVSESRKDIHVGQSQHPGTTFVLPLFSHLKKAPTEGQKNRANLSLRGY